MSTESWAIAAPQTFDVEGVTALAARLQSGRVEVTTDPQATGTRVEVAEVGDKPLLVTRDRDRLRLGYERSRMEALVAKVRSLGDSERAVVRITVPSGTQVDLGTVDADIEVTGTTGTVVKTVTGAVRTAGTHGSLYLRSVSGDVAATEHTGDVSAQVVSGALALDGDVGRVTTSSVSGAVAVTAETTVPMISAKTVSGDVAVRLGAGTPVSLKVRGAAGRVVLDGEAIASASRTLSVDQVAPGQEGRPTAYVTATVTSARVIVSRG